MQHRNIKLPKKMRGREFQKIIIGNFVPNKLVTGTDSHDGVEGRVDIFKQHTSLPRNGQASLREDTEGRVSGCRARFPSYQCSAGAVYMKSEAGTCLRRWHEKGVSRDALASPSIIQGSGPMRLLSAPLGRQGNPMETAFPTPELLGPKNLERDACQTQSVLQLFPPSDHFHQTMITESCSILYTNGPLPKALSFQFPLQDRKQWQT